ncbi:MAG: ATP-dependent Clp protease adaptor ClpS [Chloroflexota bacterium]|nr:ATP-dependent Clp protease adaptor ClpS [Chloroflexota bacterium]
MPIAEIAVQPRVLPTDRPAPIVKLEPPYRVLIHNDDHTPFDYVIGILEEVFRLSDELAEHVAFEAHNKGVAIVVIRPRPEAQKLIAAAHGLARLDGYPLTFSLEPEE